MCRLLSSAIFIFTFLPIPFLLIQAPRAIAARPPASPGPGGILRQLNLAGFAGSGQNSIQAVATDSRGNIYVAGTTPSPNFPVRNAAQPVFGEARILRTTDLGTT